MPEIGKKTLQRLIPILCIMSCPYVVFCLFLGFLKNTNVRHTAYFQKNNCKPSLARSSLDNASQSVETRSLWPDSPAPRSAMAARASQVQRKGTGRSVFFYFTWCLPQPATTCKNKVAPAVSAICPRFHGILLFDFRAWSEEPSDYNLSDPPALFLSTRVLCIQPTK